MPLQPVEDLQESFRYGPPGVLPPAEACIGTVVRTPYGLGLLLGQHVAHPTRWFVIHPKDGLTRECHQREICLDLEMGDLDKASRTLHALVHPGRALEAAPCLKADPSRKGWWLEGCPPWLFTGGGTLPGGATHVDGLTGTEAKSVAYGVILRAVVAENELQHRLREARM